MNDERRPLASREQLVHRLYEAAEVEHCLMCTYLYAAYSLRQANEGLSDDEHAAVERWRKEIVDIAVQEMGHLVAIWNITCALGAAPRFGRMNFPLDPGYLPARLVVKLAPFNEATLQHFIFLERPHGSLEPDGEGFAPERLFARGHPAARLTPMAVDYETVGEFYQMLAEDLTAFAAAHGEKNAFCGDPAQQISSEQVDLSQGRAVICLKTALATFDAIVVQGEGAPTDTENSHFRRFVRIREEWSELKRRNPEFKPSHPAATNPVLRRPPRPEGRVWLEDPIAVSTVDLANASYGLMLRALAYAYATSGADRRLALELAIGLMRAFGALAEEAARLPAGPSNPHCNAGVTFAVLRDTAALPGGAAARRFICERVAELAAAGNELATRTETSRIARAARTLADLERACARGFDIAPEAARALADAAMLAAPVSSPNPTPAGIETVEGAALSLRFEARRCIHARHCVTGAPNVFLANVQGDWLFPDAVAPERLVEIAHACPSGAITYRRKDGAPDEAAPAVNLVSTRENGPYAFRAEIALDGQPAMYRATLCRCGASRNKPFCDGSHAGAKFAASGEPRTGLNGISTDMPAVRNGPLRVQPEPDGPLAIQGNLEIVSGTGRLVGRVASARLCRCGGSASKPFCDGTHRRIGFKSS